MKKLIIKILIIVLFAICFGSGAWQTINYIEDRIITTTINLVENSEFVAEIRAMIQDIAEDVIRDFLSHGYNVILNDGTAVSVTP